MVSPNKEKVEKVGKVGKSEVNRMSVLALPPLIHSSRKRDGMLISRSLPTLLYMLALESAYSFEEAGLPGRRRTMKDRG